MELDLNALQHLTEEQRNQVVQWLHTTHQEWVAEGNTDDDLVSGVETILQLLGAEGYDFT